MRVMIRSFVLALTLLAVDVSGAHALDAAPWDRVLAAHGRRGGVDYGGLKADAAAMSDLNAFVVSVGTMPDTAPLADWLNAYNAVVVASIVARYPIRSVRDVPGFFDTATHRIAGRQRTLDSVENEVIRPRFHDARVHVALVCGAASCPPLPGHAFRQATLDATLTRLARAVVASSHHVDVQDGAVRVSEIFFWFADDFTRDAGSQLAWLKRYDASNRLAAVAVGATLTRIPYRWALNDRP